MRKVGILGGTFNPIHFGHLAVAQVVLERLKLDEIIFVPTYIPPHKTHKDIIFAKHRLAMVRLALKGNKKFSVCDFEVKKEGKSYSIDTVRFLMQKNSENTQFYFLVGSDMLPTLPTWKNFDELVKLVTFTIVKRMDYDISYFGYKAVVVDDPNLGISASNIRNSFKKGHSSRYMLPDAVMNYIVKHRLYK